MKARRLRLVLLTAVLVSFTAILRGTDEPHGHTYNVECASCHATHKAAGQSLTGAISNESLCTSCHNLAGVAARFPLEHFYKADPVNALGASHAWNVPAANTNAGATTPGNAQMQQRLAGGNILCSTCHNQHMNLGTAVAAQHAGTQTASPVTANLQAGSSGALTYTAAAVSSARGYLIDIVETAGVSGTAKFRLSNDGGLTWFGWNGSAWVIYATGNARLTGASIPLNDGTNVAATFGGTFVIGDRFKFYAGYPFLRAELDAGGNATGTKFCRDCHGSWAMDQTAAGTYDGTMKSHPVGIVLNANSGGYDRASPLDGNGTAQGGAGNDNNPTNDLKLATDGTVQCLTCHGVHHAPGNTLVVGNP